MNEVADRAKDEKVIGESNLIDTKVVVAWGKSWRKAWGGSKEKDPEQTGRRS